MNNSVVMKLWKMAGRGRPERITLEVNATWRGMAGILELLEITHGEVQCAEHQMLLRTDYRLDFDDSLRWGNRVLDEPLLLRECVDTPVERILMHGSTKAGAFAMWSARSMSPIASPWEVASVAFTTVLNVMWRN